MRSAVHLNLLPYHQHPVDQHAGAVQLIPAAILLQERAQGLDGVWVVHLTLFCGSFGPQPWQPSHIRAIV